ncbi:hypothetical protein IWW37_005324, partial [Coemansia sp. RSA 2050]
MYRLDLNFGHGLRGAAASEDDKNDPRLADSDYESDSDASDVGDYSPWSNLDRRLLQRIIGYLPRQCDRRAFCLVSREWALAGESSLWAYPEFSTPKQLASFLRVVSDRPSVYGPHIRGIRFTLASHYDRHLTSPYYCDGDSYTEAELPTLMEVAQGKHVLSTDPAVMRSLLHGSDLTSPPLALRFARMCSPIDRLSIYGFRLRDKYIVNDLMRWSLRELEIVGMPRKPLANLSYLLRNLRSLRSLRIESDSPLPADAWGPLALRLPQLHKLRIWAPSISGSHLLRAMNQAPQSMVVLHLVGRGNDASDEFVDRVIQGSPHIQSLVIDSTNITARSAVSVLGGCARLTHLELARDEPESTLAVGDIPPVVASRLATLALQNLNIPDEFICQAASVVTGLRSLHISGAAQLTGESVGALLRDSTRLTALGLFNCSRLSEELLSSLAQGPSAQSLRVLMVRQCAVQSEGVEAVLSAFPNIKHLSVVGVEIIRQQYEYIYDMASASNALDAAESQGGPDIPVQRSFKPMYPSDHHFCKSDPAHDGCPTESGEAVGTSSSTWDYQRAMLDGDSASRFVPGLLAFANGAIDSEPSVSGRRRAATISSEDHLDAGESDQASDSGNANNHMAARRLRSNSEQPPIASTPDQPESVDAIAPEEAEPELADVDRAIDRLEHEQLESAGETVDAVAAEGAAPTNEAADLEPVIATESVGTNDLAAADPADIDATTREVVAEPAVIEDKVQDRTIIADAEQHSSDVASIAGGTALALAAAGVALAAFGGESVDELKSEADVDVPAVETVADERAVEVVAEELVSEAAEASVDKPAAEEAPAREVVEDSVDNMDEPVAAATIEESAGEVVEAVADEPAVDITEVATRDLAAEPAMEPTTEATETTVETVEAIAEAIEIVAEPAIVTAEPAVETAAESIVESVEAVVEPATDEPISEAAEAVPDTAEADVERAAETVAEASAEPAVETAEANIEPIAEAAEVAAEPIAEATEAAAETTGETAEAEAEPVVEAVESAVEVAEPAAETVGADAELAVDAAADSFASMAEDVAEAAEAEPATKVAAEPIAETVAETVETATESAVEAAETNTEPAVNAAAELVEPVVETDEVVAEPVVEAVAEPAAEPVVEAATETAAEAVEPIEIVSEPVGEAVETVAETTEADVEIAEAIAEPTTEAAEVTVESIAETTRDIAEPAVEAAVEVVDAEVETVAESTTEATEAAVEPAVETAEAAVEP